MNKTMRSLRTHQQIVEENAKLIKNRTNQFEEDLIKLGANVSGEYIDLRMFKNKDGKPTIGKQIEFKLEFLNQHGRYSVLYPKEN